jgi:hypothetical protein
MEQGFPFKLPYINFAPDYYNARYGLGGAKIVTIIGFYGFVTELALKENKKKRYLLTAFCNFIMPSYILGILVGGIALFPFYRRSKKLLFSVFILSFLVSPYVVYRLNTLGFSNLTSLPKVEGFIAVYNLYAKYPSTIFIGTGLGQYISQAALWSSSYISELSTHNIPNIPFFFMSEFHHNIYGPIFSSKDSFWDLSSSAQKPYSSIVAILGEFGLIFTLFIIIQFFKRINSIKNIKVKHTVFLFVFGMFLVDNWHDSFFFIALTAYVIHVFNNREYE